MGEPKHGDAAKRARGPISCPVCGRGTLVDMAFDAGTGDGGPGERPMQLADSSEVDVYNCGHEVVGETLARADERLDVETRTSDEPVGPTDDGPRTRRVVGDDR